MGISGSIGIPGLFSVGFSPSGGGTSAAPDTIVNNQIFAPPDVIGSVLNSAGVGMRSASPQLLAAIQNSGALPANTQYLLGNGTVPYDTRGMTIGNLNSIPQTSVPRSGVLYPQSSAAGTPAASVSPLAWVLIAGVAAYALLG